ncbi:hypothetical protein [Phenylobacterium sp.]|uniref:hypothetical protein n=1 Tax=Phenylobacterium sp. TaxID=1871053 RepID=UPI00286C4F02|nr:hypothetical protein [Phenylobacterium sp.]
MRYGLGTTILMLSILGGGGAAMAQVETPPNCHWVSMPETSATLELWCRGDDGRARATGRTLQQSKRPTSDGCAAGLLYDGARCVPEAQVLAAAPQAPYVMPDRPVIPAPSTTTRRPRVLLYQDGRYGRGGRQRGMACIDDRDVTVCKPLPRY